MGIFDKPKLRRGKKKKDIVPDDLWTKCPDCGELIHTLDLKQNFQVCTHCSHHFLMGAGDRIALLVDPALSFGLPAFLAPSPGLQSGLMIAEVTSAALMSENKALANPRVVDSTPTSANQEDHVSMACHGARRLIEMNGNLAAIVGIEAMTAAQGVEFRAPLATSDTLGAVIARIRDASPTLTEDRLMEPDIDAMAQLLGSKLLSEGVACSSIADFAG